MDKNATFASPATALASSVLPVPGGPTSRTPLGIFAPSCLNLSGSRRNSTISESSSFSSSAPATSLKVTASPFGTPKRAFARVNCDMAFGLPPEQVLFVGDQIFTDCLAAHRAGVDCYLVKPIKSKETFFFRLKRAFEKPFLSIYRRRRIKSKGCN